MSSHIASLLQRRGGIDASTAHQYLTNRLAQFSDSAFLIASFPPGTALDTALAAVRYHDSQSTDDLVALLRLEARDGNLAAAEVLQQHGH